MLLKTDDIILEKTERWEWARRVLWTGGGNWKQKGGGLQPELREAREEETLAGCWMLLSESATVHMLTHRIFRTYIWKKIAHPRS